MHRNSFITSDSLVFCTAADSRYYGPLLCLIGSIHRLHYDDLGEVSVYNLGLSKEEVSTLKKIKKVQVYEIERVHPDLLRSFYSGRSKHVIGWFAWKPVVIKQELERYPYFLYVDAGTLILNSVKNLFGYIKEKGSFFIDTDVTFDAFTTKPVKQFFGLSDNWLQTHRMILAGFQGISRELADQYVIPMYHMARDHFDLFIDDGSAGSGLGWGRHDLVLFSYFVNTLNYKIYQGKQADLGKYGIISFNKGVPTLVEAAPGSSSYPQCTIYNSRCNVWSTFKKYIRYGAADQSAITVI